MTDKNTELSPFEFNHVERNNVHHFFLKKLRNIKNPVILELGVNKGSSTAKFLNYVNLFGGNLYSIDITDRSNIIHSERFKNISTKKWNFLKSNDLNLDKILTKYPELKNGIDLLYIDSYHDQVHVKKTLEKWYIYIKKYGYIFFDDTESCQYKMNKDFTHSINNDSIDELVKDFHYRNYDHVVLTKYFSGSGLSEFFKLSKLGELPNFSSKIWSYNHFIGRIYLLLKRIIYFIKSKDKKI
jgi:predicted O-methyltransferase YrrM